MYKMKTYKLHAVAFNKFGSGKWLGQNCKECGLKETQLSLCLPIYLCVFQKKEKPYKFHVLREHVLREGLLTVSTADSWSDDSSCAGRQSCTLQGGQQPSRPFHTTCHCDNQKCLCALARVSQGAKLFFSHPIEKHCFEERKQ